MAQPPDCRTDHVGSMMRPKALLDAQSAIALTDKPPSLVAAEDAAIRDVVAMQEDAGVEVVTDGEFPQEADKLKRLAETAGAVRG